MLCCLAHAVTSYELCKTAANVFLKYFFINRNSGGLWVKEKNKILIMKSVKVYIELVIIERLQSPNKSIFTYLGEISSRNENFTVVFR